MAKAIKTASRTRNWAFLHYIETNLDVELDTDLEFFNEMNSFRDELTRIGIPCAFQTHTIDKNEDGSLKKPHIHVVVSYSSVKSLAQVKEDFGHLTANGYIEPVRDMRSAIRYLSHMDNPEKAQYNEPETLNGLDISKHLQTTDKQKEALQAMKTLLAYIRENHIYYYSDLLDLLEQDGRDDLFRYAINRKLITPVLAYLKAKDTKNARARADLVSF